MLFTVFHIPRTELLRKICYQLVYSLGLSALSYIIYVGTLSILSSYAKSPANAILKIYEGMHVSPQASSHERCIRVEV